MIAAVRLIVLVLAFASYTSAKPITRESQVLAIISRKLTVLREVDRELEKYNEKNCPRKGPMKDSCEVHLTIYVERAPDKQGEDEWARKCYQVYVGEAFIDHQVRRYTFLVDRKTRRIYYRSMIDNSVIPLRSFLYKFKRSLL